MHYIGEINSPSGGSYCLLGTWGKNGMIEVPIIIDRNLSRSDQLNWNVGGHNLIVTDEVIQKCHAIRRDFRTAPVFIAGPMTGLQGRYLLIPNNMMPVSELQGSFNVINGRIEIDDVRTIRPTQITKDSFGILEMGVSTPIFYSEEAVSELSFFGPLERDFVSTE